MTTDREALRALAEAALSPRDGDYEYERLDTRGGHALAAALDSQTVLAILDERDALRADFDGLVGWLIAHCDHPTSAVMLDEDGESGRIRLWCERCQLEGPYLGRWLDDDEDAASPEQGL